VTVTIDENIDNQEKETSLPASKIGKGLFKAPEQAKAATLKKSSTTSSVSYKPRHTISQKSNRKEKEPTRKDLKKVKDSEPVELEAANDKSKETNNLLPYADLENESAPDSRLSTVNEDLKDNQLTTIETNDHARKNGNASMSLISISPINKPVEVTESRLSPVKTGAIMSMPVEQTVGEGDQSIDDAPEELSAHLPKNPFDVVTNMSGIARNSDNISKYVNVPMPSKKAQSKTYKRTPPKHKQIQQSLKKS